MTCQALGGAFSNKNELYIKFSTFVLNMEPPASTGGPEESPCHPPASEIHPASPCHISQSTRGADATKLSALSLLFSPAHQPGIAPQSQRLPKTMITDLDTPTTSPARSGVEAHQVASAFSAFSSVGCMTLPIVKTFLVVLSQSCAAHSLYRRRVRIKDVASALHYVVRNR